MSFQHMNVVPHTYESWHRKYDFFSNQKMKGKFGTFQASLNDPFNKDPSWSQFMIKSIAQKILAKGKDVEEAFKNADITGDGSLTRAELKIVLLEAVPEASDNGVSTIFDLVDKDKSNEICFDEFLTAMQEAIQTETKGGDAGDRLRWKNPIRVTRFAPARLEGWDHLDHCTKPAPKRFDDVCRVEGTKVFDNLKPTLAASPRALQQVAEPFKYSSFGGGADTAKFHRQAWRRKERMAGSLTARGSSKRADNLPADLTASPPDFADPGPDLRPGFLCDPSCRKMPIAKGFSALTPRQGLGRLSRS